MLIIGFVGPKGSGKDTAADLLQDMKLANGRISFAGPLKDICAKVFNISPTILNDPDFKERKFTEMKNYGTPITLTGRLLREVKKECAARLQEYDEVTGIMTYNVDRVAVNGLEGRIMETPRQLLQIIGTDFIRERIYKKWHLEAAFSPATLSKLSKSGIYCVTDIRFVNEYEFLKEKFGDKFVCYYVERPEKEAILAQATHPSELGVKEIRALLGEGAVLKNDGSIEDFKSTLESLKIEKEVETKPAKGSRFVYGTKS